MSEPDRFQEELPRFEVYFFVADESGDYWFKTNHRFGERPGIETVHALFEEAKQHFGVLYPDVEPAEYSVEIQYLAPKDVAPRRPARPALD